MKQDQKGVTRKKKHEQKEIDIEIIVKQKVIRGEKKRKTERNKKQKRAKTKKKTDSKR